MAYILNLVSPLVTNKIDAHANLMGNEKQRHGIISAVFQDLHSHWLSQFGSFFQSYNSGRCRFFTEGCFFHHNLPPHLKHPHDVYLYNFHVFGDLPKRVKVG